MNLSNSPEPLDDADQFNQLWVHLHLHFRLWPTGPSIEPQLSIP